MERDPMEQDPMERDSESDIRYRAHIVALAIILVHELQHVFRFHLWEVRSSLLSQGLTSFFHNSLPSL